MNSKSDLRDLRPGPRKARDLRWSALAAGPQRTHFSLWVVGDEWYVMGGVLRMLPVKRNVYYLSYYATGKLPGLGKLA